MNDSFNLEKEQSSIKTDILLIKSDVSNIKTTMSTKADIAEINAKIELIKSDVSNIKMTMATKTDIAEINAKIEHMATKAEVAEIKTDILKWMIPLFLTVIGLIITSFFK